MKRKKYRALHWYQSFYNNSIVILRFVIIRPFLILGKVPILFPHWFVREVETYETNTV